MAASPASHPPQPRRFEVARLVGAGLGAPAAPDPPLPIPYGSLHAWLADRRLLAPDWQARAAAAGAAVAGAVADFPPGLVASVLEQTATGPPPPPSAPSTWTYARCVGLRDGLVAGGHAARGLLGGLTGAAGRLDGAVRALELSGAAAAGPALALAALLDCEVPALRASIARGGQAVVDLGRRAAASRKAAASAAATHADRCSRVGVAGVGDLRDELAALPGTELPALLGGVVSGLCSTGVGEAMTHYAAFTAAMHGGGERSGEQMLPALAAVRAVGEGGGEAAAAAAAVDAAAAAAADASPPPTTTTSDDTWGITTVAGGEAAAAAAPAAHQPATPLLPPPLAALADDPAARAALGDDLAELAAFLRQRAAETGSAAAEAAVAAASGAPPPVSIAALGTWGGALAAAASALDSPRADLLFALRGGSFGGPAARVLADLEASASAEARHRAAAAEADARAASAGAGVEADRAALASALARARAAVAEAEAGAAARLGGGRTVVLTGVEGL